MPNTKTSRRTQGEKRGLVPLMLFCFYRCFWNRSCRKVDFFFTAPCCSSRLLNANKINCLRVNTFQDLQNLNLLSLYDNKLQTISKGLFAPLRSIKTLWVEPLLLGSHLNYFSIECAFLKTIDWALTPVAVIIMNKNCYIFWSLI